MPVNLSFWYLHHDLTRWANVVRKIIIFIFISGAMPQYYSSRLFHLIQICRLLTNCNTKLIMHGINVFESQFVLPTKLGGSSVIFFNFVSYGLQRCWMWPIHSHSKGQQNILHMLQTHICLIKPLFHMEELNISTAPTLPREAWIAFHFLFSHLRLLRLRQTLVPLIA